MPHYLSESLPHHKRARPSWWHSLGEQGGKGQEGNPELQQDGSNPISSSHVLEPRGHRPTLCGCPAGGWEMLMAGRCWLAFECFGIHQAGGDSWLAQCWHMARIHHHQQNHGRCPCPLVHLPTQHLCSWGYECPWALGRWSPRKEGASMDEREGVPSGASQVLSFPF